MIWREEAHQQNLWRWTMRTSYFWLFLSGIGGLLMALQRLLPRLTEDLLPTELHRLTLSTGSLLVFGWAFPLLFATWDLRLRQLRRQTHDQLPLWEMAFWIWQIGLAWGSGLALFGHFTIRPAMPWSPIAYAILAFAALLYLAVFFANLPAHPWLRNSTAFWLLFVGLWGLFFLLVLFCAIPRLADVFSSAIFDLVLGLGLFLPLLALFLPPSLYQLPARSSRLLRLFLWLYFFSLTFSAPFLSGAAQRTGFLLAAPFALAFAVLGIAWQLWLLWSQDDYTTHLYLPQEDAVFSRYTNDESTPFHIAPFFQLDPWWSWRFSPTTPWKSFLSIGLLCSLVLVFEGAIFMILRAAGYTPSPTWGLARSILWIAMAAFWFQGIHLILFGKHSEHDEIPFLKRQWYTGVGAILLWTFSLWLETMLHTTLQTAGAGRDSISPFLPRALQFIALYLTLRAFTQQIRFTSDYTLGASPKPLPASLTPKNTPSL